MWRLPPSTARSPVLNRPRALAAALRAALATLAAAEPGEWGCLSPLLSLLPSLLLLLRSSGRAAAGRSLVGGPRAAPRWVGRERAPVLESAGRRDHRTRCQSVTVPPLRYTLRHRSRAGPDRTGCGGPLAGAARCRFDPCALPGRERCGPPPARLGITQANDGPPSDVSIEDETGSATGRPRPDRRPSTLDYFPRRVYGAALIVTGGPSCWAFSQAFVVRPPTSTISKSCSS